MERKCKHEQGLVIQFPIFLQIELTENFLYLKNISYLQYKIIATVHTHTQSSFTISYNLYFQKPVPKKPMREILVKKKDNYRLDASLGLLPHYMFAEIRSYYVQQCWGWKPGP